MVNIDVNLPVDAADAGNRADTAHFHQRARQFMIDQPRQINVVHVVGFDGEKQQRARGKFNAVDNRILHCVGQVGAHAVDGRAHVVLRFVGVFFQPEFHRHGDGAVADGGADVFQAANGGDAVFDAQGDFVFHLRGTGAGLDDGDGDEGGIQIRIIFNPHLVKTVQTGHAEQEKQQDGRNRVPD